MGPIAICVLTYSKGNFKSHNKMKKGHLFVGVRNTWLRPMFPLLNCDGRFILFSKIHNVTMKNNSLSH